MFSRKKGEASLTAAHFPWPVAHFVGVGGVSMSALASALAQLGVRVSGSDVAASERTARAQAAGVSVQIGHDAALVTGLPAGAVVVHNTDVPAGNPEMVAASALGLSLAHRSEVLDWFLRRSAGPAVGVTGTHGKTTTTSLVALALAAGGLDPAVFLGAEARFLEGGNYRLGKGPAAVAELDESDGTFVRYRVDVAVVTNAEPEHLEHYGGTFANQLAAYGRFLSGVVAQGHAVLCADSPALAEVGRTLPGVLWYGRGVGADLTCSDLALDPDGSRFRARLGGEDLGAFRLRLRGAHNVSNALAAIGVARLLGLDLLRVAAALEGFTGASRRFEVLANVGGIMVVDDYAHHPSEIRETLAAARATGCRRLIAVFQPHRYQRTSQLWDTFGAAFTGADLVFLADIYGPEGEERVAGVTGAALAERIARDSGREVRFVPDPGELVAECLREARDGDLVLVMGAGNITRAAHALADRLGG